MVIYVNFMLLKTLLFILILLLGSIIFFLIYALHPALNSSQMSPEKILEFPLEAPPESPIPKKNTIRLVTYNIGYASGDKNNKGNILSEEEIKKNLETMVTHLKEMNADIIALQEVDFFSKRSFYINQLQYLANALNLPYAAYAINWNKTYVAWPYWPFKLHFGKIVSGQAVISRYPITEQKIHLFKKPSSNPFWYNWFYLDRLAQELTIELGYEKAKVWNVHLEAFKRGSRNQQLNQLGGLIQDRGDVIQWVLGDFNIVSQYGEGLPDSKKMELEVQDKQVFKDFLEKIGYKNAENEVIAFSSPSWSPQEKIDHILYDPFISLKDAGVSQNLPASDHLPVWADFKMP